MTQNGTQEVTLRATRYNEREEIGMNALYRGTFLIKKCPIMDDDKIIHPKSSLSECENFRREALIDAIAKMASTSLYLPHTCKVHATVFASSSSTSSTDSAFFRPSVSCFGQALELRSSQHRGWRGRPAGPVGVRAEGVKEKTQAIGLSRETGGQWLSCTTRHIRIYAGYVDPETKVMDQSQLDKLTLMLDPDNEFVWPEDMTEKVFNQFRELVETYAGADLTEYTLRLIGSDLEHYIRKLLLAGELKYNLDCRVLNFSMGKPRVDPAELDDVEVEEE